MSFDDELNTNPNNSGSDNIFPEHEKAIAINKELLAIEEQKLKIEELQLKIIDLKRPAWKKLQVRLTIVGVIIALIGGCGQNILSNIKSERAQLQTELAVKKRDSAEKYVKTANFDLVLVKDCLVVAKKDLVDIKLQRGNAQQSLDSLQHIAYVLKSSKTISPENKRQIDVLSNLIITTQKSLGFAPKFRNTIYDCKILKTVTQEIDKANPRVVTRKFFYNSEGNPIRIISDYLTTGQENIEFKYDNNKRLIEYNAYYTKDAFQFIHRYAYNQNRIVRDTTYITTAYPGGPPPITTCTYLKYDSQNRVIQDSVVQGTKRLFVESYSYDESGNLNKSPMVTTSAYDKNKLNPHRTNWVWMFIDRDYSINNSIGATSYNNFGLPTTTNSFRLTASISPGVVTITYDCK